MGTGGSLEPAYRALLQLPGRGRGREVGSAWDTGGVIQETAVTPGTQSGA